IEPTYEAKGVALERTVDANPVAVFGDAQRLQQIFWNLLTNAVKFTPRGGRVQVRLECIDASAVLTVSDTGIGLDSGFLPFVFDRFRQADGRSNRAYGGLGLGLSLVRHFTELHGGSVQATSDGLGRGATFKVILPLTDPIAERVTPARATHSVRP